jgi:formate dehydrogenase assembly factor FdhD
MAYDIYGNNLRKGYCEVHPHVAQEYPCGLCDMDRQTQEARRRHEETHRQEYFKDQQIEQLQQEVQRLKEELEKRSSLHP